MSALDRYHDVVRDSLDKDGWRITHDPLRLSIEETNVKIDLGAEEILGAERDGRKIAVEIKSFLSASALSDFHVALGQYLNYEYVLEEKDPERILYLAIPLDAYQDFFVGHFAQQMIRRHNFRIFVFNPRIKVIEKWID